MSNYLEFKMIVPYGKAKTDQYEVIAKSTGWLLGHIKWYSKWRQYCFFPISDTLFNGGCLTDIRDFLNSRMEQWKDNRQADRQKEREVER